MMEHDLNAMHPFHPIQVCDRRGVVVSSSFSCWFCRAWEQVEAQKEEGRVRVTNQIQKKALLSRSVSLAGDVGVMTKCEFCGKFSRALFFRLLAVCFLVAHFPSSTIPVFAQ